MILVGLAPLVATTAGAQVQREAAPTAEEMIEAAREAYRPRGLRRRCPVGAPGEIVVCPSDPDEHRVPSSLDEATAAGRAMFDGVPRAPDVFGLPSCEIVHCVSVGSPPPPLYLIDLKAIPEPLTPEEARQVLRAENPSPAGASPAAAP
jgi:hypothetical protein